MDLNMKNKKTKTASLELLNFEGPVLVAHRHKGIFFITDEKQKVVEVLTKKEFNHFINGKTSIADTQNRTWNYPSCHNDAKPSKQLLSNFLNPLKARAQKDQAKDQLIELLYSQVVELTLMSKIELGDQVISEIKRLKSIINN
jgi:hypothetical protein